MVKKICTKCKEEKDLSGFQKDKCMKSGLKNSCKECARLQAKEWYFAIGKEVKKLYRSSDKVKSSRKLYNIKQRYNLSKTDYKELVHKQTSCQICTKQFVATPNVDHCHTTGKVRGLLCSKCNLMLGHAKDDIQTLQNAIKYLEKHAELPTATSDDNNPS